MALLKLKKVSKIYRMGEAEIFALNNLSLTIEEGSYVSIMGPSGSGKSTFMHIAGLLDTPTSGQVHLKGKEISTFTEEELARLRNKEIGFIFQQFNLLPKVSAWENVALPLVYAGVASQKRKQRAVELLTRVGLESRLENTRAQLSGGQQQRVAIARALVNEPSLIFADEPTGNLDSKSGAEVMQFLDELNRDGKTIVLVTHEEDVAQHAKRQVRLQDGKIVADSEEA